MQIRGVGAPQVVEGGLRRGQPGLVAFDGTLGGLQIRRARAGEVVQARLRRNDRRAIRVDGALGGLAGIVGRALEEQCQLGIGRVEGCLRSVDVFGPTLHERLQLDLRCVELGRGGLDVFRLGAGFDDGQLCPSRQQASLRLEQLRRQGRLVQDRERVAPVDRTAHVDRQILDDA